MKTKILASVFLAAALLAGCATSSGETQARAFPPGPALFVARDGDSTMYLFGTLHIRRPGEPWGGARAQAGLAEAEEVWTELEISPESDARGQALALQYGIAPADQPLSGLLAAPDYARLTALAERLGLPAPMLDRMRPWFAAITLEVLPMVQAGYDPAEGADRLIDAFGDANGKRMRALETAEQQIAMLAGFSEAVQREMLQEAMESAEEGVAEIDAMALAWQSGDLDTLEALVVDEMREEYPDFYRVLLADRNAAWTEVLVAELEGAGVDFVAVGAGHMLGEDGLVARLRARGYVVERVE